MKAARSPSLASSAVTSQAPGAEQAHAGGGGGWGAVSPVRTLGDAPGSVRAVTDNKPRTLDLISASRVSTAEIPAFPCVCGVTCQCVHGSQQSAWTFGSPGRGWTRHRICPIKPASRLHAEVCWARVRLFITRTGPVQCCAHAFLCARAMLGSNHVSEFPMQLLTPCTLPVRPVVPVVVRRCCLT